MRRAAVEVDAIEVGDLELAAGRGLEGAGDRGHFVVVEVEPGDGVLRAGAGGLFLERDGAAGGVELDDAVALGVAHEIAEDEAAGGEGAGPLEDLGQAVAEEDVVAQDEGAGLAADELLAEDEGLGQALGARLHFVGEAQAELGAVAEERLEAGQVLGRRDDEDVADAGHHQDREGVVDHRLVVDGQELLADGPGDGKETRAGPPGEDDAFHGHIIRGRGGTFKESEERGQVLRYKLSKILETSLGDCAAPGMS